MAIARQPALFLEGCCPISTLVSDRKIGWEYLYYFDKENIFQLTHKILCSNALLVCFRIRNEFTTTAMQDTRLNTVVSTTLEQFNGWLQNPWRRVSLLLLSLFGGNFFATAITTVAGQAAQWDVVVALLLAAFVELSSWLVYQSAASRIGMDRVRNQRNIFLEMLHAAKIGTVYGLAVEALKIGS